MNVEELREYCLAKRGATESFPFDDSTLVFKVMGKMFALISLKRLPTQINLKCDPEKAVQLREQYVGNILPGYHMNKTHWNTILCEKVSPTLIKELMDHSYQTIVRKLPKSKQMLLKEVP